MLFSGHCLRSVLLTMPIHLSISGCCRLPRLPLVLRSGVESTARFLVVVEAGAMPERLLTPKSTLEVRPPPPQALPHMLGTMVPRFRRALA